MTIEALDKRVTFGMFVSGMKDRIKGILAKQLTSDEKFQMILEEMKKDVENKRITARSIRAKMIALSDPETEALEPLERIMVQREKLVNIGSKLLKEKEEAEVKGDNELAKLKKEQLQKIANEVKFLTTQQTSMNDTHITLKEAYEIALSNFKTASSAYEHAKTNGEGLLFAIKAHQEALSIRDKSRKGKINDTSFLKDMENELSKSQGELRSDKKIEDEITETSISSILEKEEENTSIIEEFRKVSK